MLVGAACLTEQAGQQGDQSSADERYTAASDQLLHALRFCTGVIVAITFEQVDDTPDTQTGTQCNDQGLQYLNSCIEKFHIVYLQKSEFWKGHFVASLNLSIDSAESGSTVGHGNFVHLARLVRFQPEAVGQETLYVQFVSLVKVGCVFVVWMFGDVEFVREKGTNAPKL